MTLEEALQVTEGSYVTSPVMYQRRPLRITKVWFNDKLTIALCRIAQIGGDQWLDLTGYDLPPKGMTWDKVMEEWVTHAEMKRRKEQRRAAA